MFCGSPTQNGTVLTRGTIFAAGLTCVASERAATDTVDYVQLYQPCDNVIYSLGSTCGDVGSKAGLKAIAALGDDKTKYVGFDYDGSQDVTCYANIGRIDGWQNNGYAALSIVLADDFSDVADVAAKVQLPDKSVKHRTKYGVAVFNLDYYYLDQYPQCPPLNLSAFKLPRPDQQDAILGSSTILITVFVLVLTMCLTVFLAIVFTTESGAEVTEGTIISMSLPPLNFPENKPPRVAQDDAHDVTHVDTNGNDGGNDDASLYAGLTCVTSERAAADTVDYVQLYQPCDNVIYRIGSACQNAGPKPGLKAIAALGDDKTKYVGFDYDGSQDITCYADLGRIDGWQNNGYAVLSVVLADDFSDVADVSGKVKIAFDAIKGTSDMDKPKIVGIEINPVDADVTKENAKKLRDLLNG
ncbi:hypothetical protein HPB49_015265 [Dermacentor silvarum]|uniref:Uncharacterized protein n=1 Tax=Dermacentor silvarum TaxID=543639 RepID=A0ACB8DPP7_DERSI|nr:hypothetical protein HPB49_015265 [Dermacentor silvarum]